jgi:predicted nucleic acid-binding protein
MKLLIDTNVFHKIFDKKHAEFEHFAVPHKCLFDCKGRMVLGGTTFRNEIYREKDESGKPNHFAKYRRILLELRKINSLEILDEKAVDKEEKRVIALEPSPDFDDPHIIACVIVGKVQVVCTDDKRSDRFVLDKKFYPKGHQKPKIYRDKRNVHLFNPCFP